MFGNTGSYTDFTGVAVQSAFLAERHHVRAGGGDRLQHRAVE